MLSLGVSQEQFYFEFDHLLFNLISSFVHESSMSSHEPRVGTGTTGPGEAVFAIQIRWKTTIFHENVEKQIIASGLPASPGAASGKVVFSADEAEK